MNPAPTFEELVLDSLTKIRAEIDAIREQSSRPVLTPTVTVRMDNLADTHSRVQRLDRCLSRLADHERALNEYDKYAAPEGRRSLLRDSVGAGRTFQPSARFPNKPAGMA